MAHHLVNPEREYRQLQKRLDRNVSGAPASPVLTKILKLLFTPDTLLMPSSEGISTEVRQNPNAIGYDGLGYVTPDQKVLAVARDASSPYVLPSVATVNNRTYPISRFLYMYTIGEPSGQVKAYLDWVLGPGQKLVSKLGFVPLH